MKKVAVNKMIRYQQIVFWASVSALWLMAIPVHAPAQTPISVSQQRQEVMELLNDYAGDDLLLEPADRQAWIDKVQAMPDAEFAQWYRDTSQVRALLHSQPWQETRSWLREFLAVQAIYSDQQIEQFRRDLMQMSPPQMADVLQGIIRQHRTLIAMRAASERNRQLALSSRNETIHRQQAARLAAGGTTHRGYGFPSAAGTGGPQKSSYAQRMQVYRRNPVWLGVLIWGRW